MFAKHIVTCSAPNSLSRLFLGLLSQGYPLCGKLLSSLTSQESYGKTTCKSTSAWKGLEDGVGELGMAAGLISPKVGIKPLLT